MPLYDIKCTSCSALDEVLCSFDELKNKACAICGAMVMRRQSLFARHGSWSGCYSGYYDRGLGVYVESYHHREQVMKEKGLRPVSSAELDAGVDTAIAETQKHNDLVKQFTGG